VAYFVIPIKKVPNKKGESSLAWLEGYHMSLTDDMYGPFGIWKAMKAAKDLPQLLSSEDHIVRCVIVRGGYFLIDGHHVLGFFGLLLAIFFFFTWPVKIFRIFFPQKLEDKTSS